MTTMTDMELLQDYATRKTEEAFSTLVSRHINLVYSAAFRQVGNRQEAEEVTQAVFVVLAKKAGTLRVGTVISGWLYQTARLTGANALRREIRRQNREREAYMQSTLNEPEPDSWAQIGPLLEQAMSGLTEADRNAIVLRYFESKPLKDVGAAIGTSDDAAKMRINRALEKLRTFFLKRGVTLSGAAIGAAISAHSIQAAPAGLSTTVVAVACQGSALTAATLTLAKGTLKLMAWTKLNIAVGVAAAAVIALQWNQIAAERRNVAMLQEQYATVSKQLESGRAAAVAATEKPEAPPAPKEVNQLERANAKLAARNAALRAALSSAPPAASNDKSLAKMMSDPSVLKAMLDMQAPMIRKQYSALVKQLNLSPEQRDAFYDLLISSATNAQSLSLQMLSGTNNTEAAMAVAAAQKTTDEQIKSMLGDGGYAQYKDYQSTLGDRTMLDQYQSSFTDNPLTETQQQQLLQLMKTEREAATAQSASAASPQYSSVFDKLAAADQQLQVQEMISQRVLQQSAGFLSAEQVQLLGSSQSNLLNMEKMSMTLAQKMFTSPQAGATPSAQ